MTASIAHRGPGDDGYWYDARAGVGLGNRRLSIVDLSPLGHQPMAFASGRYRITYDGEVHFRRDLQRQGHSKLCMVVLTPPPSSRLASKPDGLRVL